MCAIRPPTDDAVRDAAAALERGELVAFPTETVYGLGADAHAPAAVRAIFAAKGRPADHPVIVHVRGAADIERYVAPLDEATRTGVEALSEAFWPGPLTLVLPRGPAVPDEVTGGQPTVGLRCPAHPVARRLLAAFGRGVAAPSANPFGRISPTRPEHVERDLGAAVSVILGTRAPADPPEVGAPEVGIESTIVALGEGAPKLLRPGAVTREQLERVLGVPVPDAAPTEGPRASGRLPRHYAPRTPLRYLPGSALGERIRREPDAALLSRGARPATHLGPYRRLPDDPRAAARELYGALRDLDASEAPSLLVEAVPDRPEWAALRDRLERAAEPADPDPDRLETTENDPDPVVAVLMGSTSDWETMRHADATLDELGVPHVCRVVSAHRTPDRMRDAARNAEREGVRVIVAGAGGAAHLPGMLAAYTRIPVLGVPVESRALSGLDSLLSIVQMPRGVPVGTLAIGRSGAVNAALLAAAILALGDAALAGRLERYRAERAEAAERGELPTPNYRP